MYTWIEDDLEVDHTTVEFEFEDSEDAIDIRLGDVGVVVISHDEMFMPADGDADSDVFEGVAFGYGDWEASDVSTYEMWFAVQVASDAETGDYDVVYEMEEIFDSPTAELTLTVTVKKAGGFPLLLVLFLLAAAGGAGYYFTMT